MAGLLGQIFSAGNVAKRQLRDLLGNPVLGAQQMAGNLNDRARNLNEMTSAAAREGMDYGPATQRLAGLMADAYNPMGLTVFHGSPAKFSKFDRTKIGSGEGAQAYGYGHYVAESPDVAEQYKETLKSKAFSGIVKRDRNVYDVVAPDGTVISQGTPLGPASKAKDAYDANVGSVYEIDLPDEQIARMLDWDKPLSEQPQKIQQAIYNDLTDAGYSKAIVNDLLNRKTGMELYKTLYKGMEQGDETAINLAKKLNLGEQGMMMEAPALASESLRRMGIPGIRYFDQGSRGTGEGTSNFVVFPGNEDLLTILKRNGGLLD